MSLLFSLHLHLQIDIPPFQEPVHIFSIAVLGQGEGNWVDMRIIGGVLS